MTVHGKRCRAAQISAVGTDPAFRGHGLSTELLRRARTWAEPGHRFFFLFADRDAYPFYHTRGFHRVDEHAAMYPVIGQAARSGVEKLDGRRRDHRDLIYRCAVRRTAVSDLLGVWNAKLLMFWCLYFLPDALYYLREFDLLVLAKHRDRKLLVYDLVGKTIPPFTEIYPFLGDESDRVVEFRFMVDKLHLNEDQQTKSPKENGTHVSETFPLMKTKFIFPCTCQA
jgi:hypothetical protein